MRIRCLKRYFRERYIYIFPSVKGVQLDILGTWRQNFIDVEWKCIYKSNICDLRASAFDPCINKYHCLPLSFSLSLSLFHNCEWEKIIPDGVNCLTIFTVPGYYVLT